MLSGNEEALSERLLRIHALWAHPPTVTMENAEGWKLASMSCFNATLQKPLYQKWRFRDEYELPGEDINWWFHQEKAVSEEGTIFSWPFFDMLFESCFGVMLFPKITSKIIVQHLSSKFPDREKLIDFICSLDREDFSEFIRECGQYEYSWKYIQEIINLFLSQGTPLIQLTLEHPYVVNNNEQELEALCDKAISENPKSVEDYRKGKFNSINHLKGQIMKMTKGKADPSIVNKILENKLAV